MVDQDTKQRAEEMAARDDFPIKGFSHLEWWVGNAYQTAQYLRTMLGFQLIGYRGPETGVKDTSSYLLASEDIRFVISGALTPEHPITHHVAAHGPGVHDVALAVPDAEAAFELAVNRGAEPAYKTYVLENDRGRKVMAGLKAYGETIHSLVEGEGRAARLRANDRRPRPTDGSAVCRSRGRQRRAARNGRMGGVVRADFWIHSASPLR